MNNSPSSDRDEQATDPEVKSSQSPQETSFWLRDLPYAVVFVLALFGIAYNSYSKQSIVGYWEFLALAICMVCASVLDGRTLMTKRRDYVWSGRKYCIGLPS